jgi:hypothetical protein
MHALFSTNDSTHYIICGTTGQISLPNSGQQAKKAAGLRQLAKPCIRNTECHSKPRVFTMLNEGIDKWPIAGSKRF